MRRASAILALAAALLLAALWGALRGPDPADQGVEREPPPSGMALAMRYGCHPGETRHTVVHGVEDDFSPAGREPAGMHPRLVKQFPRLAAVQTDYDADRPDRVFGDWFEPPSTMVSALLVARLRPIGENRNDTLMIGDRNDPARHVATGLVALAGPAPWRSHGDLYWVELSDLRTTSGRTITDLVRETPGGQILDVAVQDDTAVDFLALTWCEAPTTRMGVTFSALEVPPGLEEEIAAFECRPGDRGPSACNPFVGDAPCDAELPLLCFRDLSLPTPPAARFSHLTSRRWSGGEVAATAPVRASRFRTIGEADRACAGRFGRGWRVAEWHDGGPGFGFGAHPRGQRFSGRYWIDIRGSPYGACWSRDHDR